MAAGARCSRGRAAPTAPRVMCGAPGASSRSSASTASVKAAVPPIPASARMPDRVRQLHQLRDGGVEMERPVLLGDGGDGRCAWRGAGPAPARPPRRAARHADRCRLGLGDGPDAGQEAVDALDPGRVPGTALVPRADEHQEQPDRVAAVSGRQVVGVHDVAARLAHALVVGAQDLPLVAQRQEGLVEGQVAHVAQRLDEEARVHQVQHRVLGAAGVQVDRHPVRHRLRIPGRASSFGRAVAQEIPGRVDERVHGVGLAPRLGAARPGRWPPGSRRATAAGSPRSARSRRPPAAGPAAGPPAPAAAPCSGQYTIGIGAPQ